MKAKRRSYISKCQTVAKNPRGNTEKRKLPARFTFQNVKNSL
nr:MAG TPA: hypothetical protein [Caudoviricetes sp.]